MESDDRGHCRREVEGDEGLAMKKQQTILLSVDQTHALNKIAESMGKLSRTGVTNGKPSWRALVHALADGELRLAPLGKTPRAARKKRRPKKPWRGNGRYPARWWAPDANGEMLAVNVVEKSGMTQEALTSGGMLFGGDLCSPPPHWKGWWEVETSVGEGNF